MKLLFCLLLALAFVASMSDAKSTKSLCKRAKGEWKKETQLTRCEANVNGCRGLGCYCRPMMEWGPAEPVLATREQLEEGFECVKSNAAGWVNTKAAKDAEKAKKAAAKQAKKDAKKTKRLCKKAKGLWTEETKLTNCGADVDGCQGLGCYCRPMMDYGPAEPVRATLAQLQAGAKCVDGDKRGFVNAEADAKKAEEKAAKKKAAEEKKAKKDAEKMAELCKLKAGTLEDDGCHCPRAYRQQKVLKTVEALKEFKGWCPKGTSRIYTQRRANCIRGGGRFVVLKGNKLKTHDIFYKPMLFYKGKDYWGSKKSYGVIDHDKVRGYTLGCQCDPLSTTYVQSWALDKKAFRCKGASGRFEARQSTLRYKCERAGGKVKRKKWSEECICEAPMSFMKDVWIYSSELESGRKCDSRCTYARMWLQTTGGGKVPKKFRGC